MNNLSTIRVLIIDDLELYVRGMQHIFQQNPHFKVVGHLTSNDAFKLPEWNSEADVVILGVSIPLTTASRVLEKTSAMSSTMAVVAMSDFHQDKLVAALIRKGVKGCLLRSASKNELYEAVRLVAQDKRYYSGEIEKRLCYYFTDYEKQKFNIRKFHDLTELDLQLTRLMCEGLTLKEIARKWKMNTRALQYRKKKIYEEAGVSNLIELINYAVVSGIYHPVSGESANYIN